MRRRGVTVLLGALVTTALAVGVTAAPMPYVVLGPGPTVDTLGKSEGRDVIQVTRTDVSSSAGQLRLTTVGVQSSAGLVQGVQGWLDGDRAVVPRELIYPPDQTEQQVEQENAEEFRNSQTSAETVALRELGYPLQTYVKTVAPDGPSTGRLAPGDVLTAVGGAPVTGPAKLTELIRARPAGSTLDVAYTRDGRAGTARITTREEGGRPRIGVEIATRQPHPFTVTIDLGKIGGPSAGLMFTLGIIDKLRPADLTGGRIIAGTGTIDDDGRVGPIGGIPQKLVAARRDGAQLFLVPAGNCTEALDNAVPGLPMAKVATVDDALTALTTFTGGGTPTPCT